MDCKSAWGGSKKLDACGQCGGDNSTCVDCFQVVRGTAQKDQCGKCLAFALLATKGCKEDCKGLWGGGAVADACTPAVCGGDNSTCASTTVSNDISFGGSASDYARGSLKFNNTIKAIAASLGIAFADIPYDSVAVDGGRRRRMLTAQRDHRRLKKAGSVSFKYKAKLAKNANVSKSFGNMTSSMSAALGVSVAVAKPAVIKFDCFAVPNGNATSDKCGVCNGTNKCLDCLGMPNGGNRTDK